MAPVISVSPALTMSAARESDPGPNAAACWRIRSIWSSGGCAARRSPVGHRGHDDEVAQPLEQVLDEASRVEPALDDTVDLGEDAGAVAGGEGVDDRVEQLAVGEAEQRSSTLVGQALLARARDELVEDGERVPDGATPRRTTKESTPGATVTPSAVQSSSM